METTTIRQGDLLFIPVDAPQIYPKDKNRKIKDGIIRRGEATGHHHKLENLKDASVYRRGNAAGDMPWVITGKRGAKVVHQEHKPVRLAPNTTYRIHVAREFDITEGPRFVAD